MQGRAGLHKHSSAAAAVLTGVIKNSIAQTTMGLEKELKDAAAALQR
jgi:hypothetical protein